MSRSAVEEALKNYASQILDQYQDSVSIENEKKRMAFMKESLENQITNQAQIGELIDAANSQTAHLERMADALEHLAESYARTHLK